MSPKRRTQEERRSETQAKLLASACQLFGERGFAKVSLDEIAAHCGLTIGPIYHYYRNKKALFTAVSEEMERRVVVKWEQDKVTEPGYEGELARWNAFLELCNDPGFRQIVLIDSPNVLGRERWKSTSVTNKARELFFAGLNGLSPSDSESELMWRMSMAAFAEAALAIAESDEPDMIREQANKMVTTFLRALFAADH